MNPFKEGDVVMCKGHAGFKDDPKQVAGTVVWLFNSEAAVLDASGFIHMSRVAEIYEYQEDGA